MKAGAGWFAGANSNRLPWLLPDSQFTWGENIATRGGIAQTRPGYKVSLTLPEGNPQGLCLFTINNPNYTGTFEQVMLIAAISGVIYAIPYPWQTPVGLDYSQYIIPGLNFSPDANQIVFCIAKQSAALESGTISIVPTQNVLMIQDGLSQAGYYDGVNSGQLNENSPALQTPRGLWMAWSGDRLWVARGSTVIAGDIGNPLSFTERLNTGEGLAGDFQYPFDITALADSQGQSNQSALIIWTNQSTNSIQSQITDRSTWSSTPTFQQVIYPSLGCIAGKSITNSNGLLWWYSPNGLVSSDSAARYYLTSQIKYADVKMARCKQNLNPDLTQICGSSFENYLLMSVPFGDTLNANTMVMDASELDELEQQAIHSWQVVWTGTRPVEWASGFIQDQFRIFFLSRDYQNPNGSYNHVWEAFTPYRYDLYEYTDANNTIQLAPYPIYCSLESKQYGDTMDWKTFQYAEIDLAEVGGTVSFKVGYSGQIGSYNTILQTTLQAQTDETQLTDPTAITLYNHVGQYFRKQFRRLITTQAPDTFSRLNYQVESIVNPNIDKAFGLLIQWCGQAAIQCFRIFMNPYAEYGVGQPTQAEDTTNIVLQTGTSFIFDTPPVIPTTAPTVQPGTNGFVPNTFAFLNAFTQRYQPVFYSSIPVSWQDLPQTDTVNLPCCRSSFSPPTEQPILIEGVYIP